MTQFRDVATTALDTYLVADPVTATYLGDHRFDGRLPDPSPGSARARATEVRDQMTALDAVATSDVGEQVDAEVLRTVLRAELFELDALHEGEWNPMSHNPGGGLHALLTRDFAPLPERLISLASRLDAVPDYLARGRERLGEMSRIHLDTALKQLDGTLSLLDDAVPTVLAEAPDMRGRVEAAVRVARDAVAEHRAWLGGQAEAAHHPTRIGEHLFAAKLALTLDTEFAPKDLLARAEADLDESTRQIIEQAGRFAGVARPNTSTVRAVLDRLGADAPTDATILGRCRDALADATRFVREHDLVTVYDDPIVVVEMPEIDRGVSVAYCRPSGPLESAELPTEIAVSPTPADWTPEQQASLYREYNSHMLHNLAVHEAMPGHALQLAHSNRYRASTPVRAVWWSGPFVEGWAVYTEELMAEHGYRSDVSPEAASALRLQQLKMRLRSIINTIMDIRFHNDDLDEAAAMRLMTERGFQEQGEAAGKWRRVQLSATQLCTYYVGYSEMRDLIVDLRRHRPQWTERELHDAVLSAGSPPPRHLRTVLGA
jgi:hypothetical protein